MRTPSWRMMISRPREQASIAPQTGPEPPDNPPTPRELGRVLQYAADSRSARCREAASEASKQDARKSDERFLSRLATTSNDKLVLIQLAEVSWIQSKGDFVCLHSRKGNYKCRTTMNNLCARLDPNCFLRVHRNAIVNLDHVREFDLPRRGNAFVYLCDGQALPISRTGRMALRRGLLSYA